MAFNTEAYDPPNEAGNDNNKKEDPLFLLFKMIGIPLIFLTAILTIGFLGSLFLAIEDTPGKE